MTPTPRGIARFHKEVQIKQWLCGAIEAAETDGRSVSLPMSAQAAAVARYIVDANLPPVDLKPLSEREQDTLLSVVAVVYELRRELREKFRTLFNGLLRLEYAYTGNEDLVSLLEREYGDP